MKPFKILFAALVVFQFTFASWAFAQVETPEQAAETENVETENADSVEPTSYETPDEALRAFFEGIASQERERALNAVVNMDGIAKYVDSMIELIDSMDAFAAADTKQFGEGAMPQGLLAKSLIAGLQNVELEKVNEDQVQWAKNPNNPLIINRTDEGWKVDFSHTPEFIKLAADTFGKTKQLFDGMRESIENGDFENRDELRKELAQRKVDLGL